MISILQGVKCSAVFAACTFLSVPVLATTVEGTSKLVIFKDLPQDTSLIRVSGPQGFLTEIQESPLTSTSGLKAGQYRYDVLGKTKVEKNVDLYKQSLNSGRDESVKPRSEALGRIDFGYFRVSDSKVVVEKNIKE